MTGRTQAPPVDPLTDDDYRRLLVFRDGVRRFLHWSESQAAAVGLTAAQHQLLLAVRGHVGDRPPTIGDVAERMLLKHHSAVELVARACAAGLLDRRPDPDDRRVVRLTLTALGAQRLSSLSVLHLEELRRLEPGLQPLWSGVD